MANSRIVAADAQHKFFRFDLEVAAYSDSHVQAMAAALLGPADALVAISHSGRSRELLEAVGLARANGCPVIAITASGERSIRSATGVSPVMPKPRRCHASRFARALSSPYVHPTSP